MPSLRLSGVALAAALVSMLVAATVGSAATPALPDPPYDIYAEPTRADAVQLSWKFDDSKFKDARFTVLRNGQPVAETKDKRFLDTWLTENTTYEYVVRVEGTDVASSPFSVTTPASIAREIGPYLQQLTPTRVSIVWQTYEFGTTSLEFAPVGQPLALVYRDGALSNRHVATVNGLIPGTAYQYRWGTDGRWGDLETFRTPPADQSKFEFGVIGDYGIGTSTARSNVRRLVADRRLDFVITTGDNAQNFGNAEEYRNFVLGPLKELVQRKPFWPSVGNHDYYGLGNYKRYFQLPDAGLYYEFDYGPVKFLSLDSNGFTRKQRSWARDRLAAAKSRCTVAYFHHPIWSSGSGYRSAGRKRRKQQFVPLLQRGGVDLVLNGHIHNYERSKPLRSGKVSRSNGITYITSGGGGAHPSRFHTKRKPKWSARRGEFFHRLRISYADNRLRGQTIDAAGRTRDRFTIPCR